MAIQADPRRAPGHSRGVQSIERAFSLLEMIAENDGIMGLSVLAAESGLPLPTAHRQVRTLVDLGYLRQGPDRHYILGPRLIRLGEAASGTLAVWARPHLARLVDEIGESANLAMLDGDQIVYVAQVPSKHSMRMFTEPGRRVLPHCTAVGKVVMVHMEAAEVRCLLERTGMPRETPHTITDPDSFARAITLAAERGYALDEGEQEVGVRCVAVAVPGAPSHLALSISGPVTRMTETLVARAVPLLHNAARGLLADLQ